MKLVVAGNLSHVVVRDSYLLSLSEYDSVPLVGGVESGTLVTLLALLLTDLLLIISNNQTLRKVTGVLGKIVTLFQLK